MATPTAQRIEQQEEVVVKAPPAKEHVPITPIGTIREAAQAAAEAYAPDEVEQHARTIMAAWAAKMKRRTRLYVKQARELVRSEKLELAGPITQTTPPYPWWNLLIAGPYQPDPAGGGPYMPHKIFEPSEQAFLIGGLWLNPEPINWSPAGPSAAELMAGYDLTIRFETINLTTVQKGPSPGSVNMNPIFGWPDGDPDFKTFRVDLGPNIFPLPPQGQPYLYELNVTADVTGPAPQSMAGFATWVFDPDEEPSVWPPPTLPSDFPPAEWLLWWWPQHWQFERPIRLLVYRR